MSKAMAVVGVCLYGAAWQATSVSDGVRGLSMLLAAVLMCASAVRWLRGLA